MITRIFSSKSYLNPAHAFCNALTFCR